MRWTVKKKVEVGQWHPWFAWKPVKVGNENIWLEKIFRRAMVYNSHGKPVWGYAADESEILKDKDVNNPSADQVGQGPVMQSRVKKINQMFIDEYNGQSGYQPWASLTPPSPPPGPECREVGPW